MKFNLDNEYEMPEAACPACGAVFDRASGSGSKPEPGSLSICIRCAAMLQFTSTLELAELTAAEFLELPDDVQRELRRISAAVVTTGAMVQSRQPKPERPALSMWTIYDHPSDLPEYFVARQWLTAPDAPVATSLVIKSITLERLREILSAQGLVCMPRAPNDDPGIVETWL